MTTKPTFTIYHNPRCSKSRATLEMLRAHDIELDIIHYLEQVPTVAELEKLAAMLDTHARGLMRASDELYKELDLDHPELTEEQLYAALIDHPKLLQRPIVVHLNEAVFGRPPENVMRFFDHQ